MTACVALLLSVRAQDVVTAPLTWFDAKEAPDELPVRKGKRLVKFPPDLRKTTEVGWAALEWWLDAEGRARSAVPYGTQPLYLAALKNGDAGETKFQPGRRERVPVSTHVCDAVIFNPASANPKSPDSTPRLLAASLIVDPSWQEDHWRDSLPPHRVVWAEVALDAEGRVAGLKAEDPATEALLRSSVQIWRFAPARQAGQPVASALRVPFILLPTSKAIDRPQELPRVISRREPVYPPAMLRSGLRGDVVVEFTVDPEGRVKDATVVRTLNPGFNDAALEAVTQFRFEPARVDGRAVSTRMQQPLTFSIREGSGGGDDGMEIRQKVDLSKLPPELRYDTGPKIAATVLPKYPYALLRSKTTGTAVVNLLVGRDGKVIFSRVLRADRPELGLALQAAVDLFEYLPALKDGRPTMALIAFEQEFRTLNSNLLTEEDLDLLKLEAKHPERLLKAAALDHRLKPTVTRGPIFPKADAAENLDRGSAMVEFLVDERGVVRLPRVVTASDPVFGYAAVQAVAEWRFEPPTSQGRPGIVRVQVPVDFNRPPATAAAPASASAP